MAWQEPLFYATETDTYPVQIFVVSVLRLGLGLLAGIKQYKNPPP
jgi:hypothetical protein